MDAKLAAIYGTNQPNEADLQKLAEAELAEKLASDNQIDVENMSDEQVEALAQATLEHIEGGEEKTASEDESAEDAEENEEEAADEAEETEEASDESAEDSAEETEETEESGDEEQEKVAEADQLGRIMAHSFVQELRSIETEKVAKAEGPGNLKGKLTMKAHKAKDSAKALPGKVMNAVKDAPKNLKAAVKSPKFQSKVTQVGMQARHNRGKLGLAAGAAAGAAAAVGAKKAAKKSMTKKSSALDTLATMRAQEILEQNGIKIEETETETKTASAADVLAAKVEERAWEILQANGYVEDSKE